MSRSLVVKSLIARSLVFALLFVFTCLALWIGVQVRGHAAIASTPSSITASAQSAEPPAIAQSTPSAPATRNQTAPLDFQGRMLVSISDADMVASAYVDRQLGPREGEDALSILPLGGDYRRMQAIELAGVTNSVAGPPSAVTVSPDGRWTFVVESFRPATPSMQLFTDLERGNRLTAIDLSNPRQPRIHQQLEVGTRPETVEISPQGDMLLVTLHPADGRQLAFVPWNEGEFGTPIYTTLPDVAGDVRVSHAV